MEKQKYKALCEQASNGSTKAFTELYETVYREMYYTALYSLKDGADAVETVTGAAREGFSAIGKLKNEKAFRVFMMKILCARIKQKFKQYAAEGVTIRYDAKKLRPNADGVDIKQEFNRLSDIERLVTCLYVVGKFPPEEISQFTGLSSGTVRKKLEKALESFMSD